MVVLRGHYSTKTNIVCPVKTSQLAKVRELTSAPVVGAMEAPMQVLRSTRTASKPQKTVVLLAERVAAEPFNLVLVNN